MSYLDDWFDPYGCQDVGLASDVIRELQSTIRSQERDTVELVGFVHLVESFDREINSSIISDAVSILVAKHTKEVV